MDAAALVRLAREDTPALLEVIDRDGLVRQAWRIDRWPVSIGRALDNTVVLSDPHVAAHHATIDVVPAGDGAPAAIVVAARETKNGLVVGKERLGSGTSKQVSDDGRDLELHIGRSELRLRLPGHALAAEQVLSTVVREPPGVAAHARRRRRRARVRPRQHLDRERSGKPRAQHRLASC